MENFTHDDYQALFSDMYKDAWGTRPRHVDTSAWTDIDFENEISYLSNLISANEALEAEAEAINIKDIELRIWDIIKSGANNRETAIRWLHDSYDTMGDNDYLCYKLGIPYGYFTKAA